MVGFCKAVLDVTGLAAHIEHMRYIPGCWPVTVARRESKLDAVISQDCMDLVGNSLNHSHQEIGGRVAVGFVEELNKNKLRCSVNGHKKIEFSFLRAHFGNIDVEVSNRILLELFLWLVAFNIRQPADVMTLKATVQA